MPPKYVIDYGEGLLSRLFFRGRHPETSDQRARVRSGNESAGILHSCIRMQGYGLCIHELTFSPCFIRNRRGMQTVRNPTHEDDTSQNKQGPDQTVRLP